MGKIWDFDSFGAAPALIDDKGMEVSYAGLFEANGKIFGLKLDRALAMMFCQNTVGAISCYAAFLDNGLPMMLLSAGLSEDIKGNLMKVYRPAYILLPEEQRGGYPFMTEILKLYDYVVLKTNYDEVYPVHPELGLLLTTSGSTGSVKFVRQSFENIRFNAETIADYLDITSRERTITALPMQYTYGVSMINSTLLKGGVMIVTDKSFMEESFWDFFEEQRVTGFHGVPNTYGMLSHIGIFEEDFEDLRLLSQAGGKLSVELQSYYGEYAREHGKRFVIMYGQCEATAAISYLPPEQVLDKPGSVGIPIPGGRVVLKNEQGDPIEEPGHDGELCYEGPNVAMGYALCGEDLSREDEWNGSLRTGDIARRDEDGYYYVTGRLKRFVKISGHRVSLDEIDEKIMEALHILSVSSGRDDHLVIFVTGESEKEAVSQFIKKNVPTVRPSFQVALIDEFPKNEAGKIRYGELLSLAEKLLADK